MAKPNVTAKVRFSNEPTCLKCQCPHDAYTWDTENFVGLVSYLGSLLAVFNCHCPKGQKNTLSVCLYPSPYVDDYDSLSIPKVPGGAGTGEG